MKINEQKTLEKIWHQVPVDYYQQGIKSNIWQRLWHKNKLKSTITIINKTGVIPKRILDVGCAGGWFLSEIAKIYPTAICTGVDVYSDAIEYARKTYPEINFVKGDAHKLPFKDNNFDLVICNEVLEHVLSPEQVITEIKRVLSPRGMAIIEMDTGNFLFRLAWYFWTNLNDGVWKDAHLHIFNTKKLEKMIRDGNFIINKKRFFNFYMAVIFLLKK